MGSHSHRPGAAHGGVATLWAHDVDPFAECTEHGNSRILVTTFDFPGSPLCVINCYLPSGTASDAIQKYNEDTDIIFETTLKFGRSHDVLIIGDLNEDHFRRDKTKERAVKKLIIELKLTDLGSSTAILDMPRGWTMP